MDVLQVNFPVIFKAGIQVVPQFQEIFQVTSQANFQTVTQVVIQSQVTIQALHQVQIVQPSVVMMMNYLP